MKTYVWRWLLRSAAGIVVSLFTDVASCKAQTLGEALDATNIVWTTGGDAVWFVETTNTYDGIDAVQSGIIYSNQTSWLETTVIGPATISFWSTQQRNSQAFPPFLWNFTINGSFPENLFMYSISPPWSEQIYDLGNGTNVLRWTASIWPHGTASGFVFLDEFTVSPARPLAIVDQPMNGTVYSGKSVTLSVSAVGTPPLEYQWSKDETNISNATNSSLSFDETTTNDTGIYSVVVCNSQGSVVSSNALLTVLPPSPPFFTSEPESTTVYAGQYFLWWASVDGSPPSAAVWQKDGTNFFAETFIGPFGYNPSLTFTNVSMSDAGIYRLFVTNDYGGTESTDAVLTVVASVAPTITHQPRSLEVAEGVNTWMSVAATGVPDPWYIWFEEGVTPPPSGPLPPPRFFGSNPHRSFNNVTTNDAGVYFAVATNYAGGVASQDALLTVLPAMTNIGSWNQDAQDIFVTNGLAYLARGTNGLAILDVNDPASPQLIGSWSTPGYASVVQVSDGLAFVADTSGLRILSVTNPSNPVLLGGYNISGIEDITVRSNLVFAADGDTGLLILNVANPNSPRLVGSYTTNIRSDYVCVAGDYVVFSSPFPEIGLGTNAAHVEGLVVLDVSNPGHPSEIGRLSLGLGRITSRDPLVFGADLNAFFQGMQVITITNPAQPTVIGSFDSYPSTNLFQFRGVAVSEVRIVNDLAYLIGNSGGQSGLYVLDVRDPTDPIPAGYYTDAGQPTNLAVDGNRVYFSGYNSPLEIIGTPFNTNPVPAPGLSLSTQPGLNLRIQGRRGLHYQVEYADRVAGAPWQILQTILLTNDTAVVQLPSVPMARFFRLKQLD